MKRIILAVITALAFTGAAQGNFYTGNKLHTLCNSDDKDWYSKGACVGYVIGAVDALMFAQTTQELRIFCLPKQVTAVQVVAVIKKYLRENPQDRHYQAGSEISAALAENFPCK